MRRNPAAGAALPFVEDRVSAGPVSAADFFVEPDEPAQQFVLPATDNPEAIALELGLDRALSATDLNRARRRFMWRNHPDRCDAGQRGLADRRVAVANMLIDRALAKLAGGGRRA